MSLQDELDALRAEFVRSAPPGRAALYDAKLDELRRTFPIEKALLNLRGFRHAAVEGAEHQVLLTVSIEAQADERCSVELLSAILALNRALHPDG
jgi:hypothetical protein